MIRRHAVAGIAFGSAAILFGFCALLVFNFMQLGQAQAFAQDFARHAVDEGSGMQFPLVAPSAAETLSRDKATKMLMRAHQIGPVIAMSGASCLVQTDAKNLCGGQLLACVVEGTGSSGTFEADIAMCRGGNLAPYLLAGSQWHFQFTNGDPLDETPSGPI